MTDKDYDKAYAEIATLIGHKTFLIRLFQNEIECHLKRCEDLNRMKAALIEKDKNVSKPE
jgi:hypothetical protein